MGCESTSLGRWLYKVKLADGTALECLWRNESGRVISGLCSSEEKIYFSDQGKSQIHCLDTDSSSIKLLSGKAVESEKLTSQDGLAVNASHAQCGPLTMMGKTLVVGDIASVSLRLVSDMKCLLSYQRPLISCVRHSLSTLELGVTVRSYPLIHF